MTNLPGNYLGTAGYRPRHYDSKENRIGQVGAFLAISSHPVTTHQIARWMGITPRRVSQLCQEMYARNLIAVEEVQDHRMPKGFKWLISGRKPS